MRILYKILLRYFGYSNDVANFIICQSVLESANYTSAIYHENNNLFGMKLAKWRRTFAIGENRGHAMYKCKLDSLLDLILRHEYFKILKESKQSIQKYCEFLQHSKYAEDTYYCDKILRIYQTNY